MPYDMLQCELNNRSSSMRGILKFTDISWRTEFPTWALSDLFELRSILDQAIITKQRTITGPGVDMFTRFNLR